MIFFFLSKLVILDFDLYNLLLFFNVIIQFLIIFIEIMHEYHIFLTKIMDGKLILFFKKS